MTIKALVFDMDGTLLNTLGDLATATNKALLAHGFAPHPEEAYRYFVGSGARNLISRALPEAARTQTAIDACLATFHEIYDNHWDEQTHLYEGLAEVLNDVQHDYQLAILTNKPQPFAELCVRKFLHNWDWAKIQGQQDGIAIKPSTEVSSRVTEALAVAPKEVLYFGDSDVDMQTANNAGYTAVGVSWGFRSEQELRAAGAQHLIHKPTDILNLLESR